ncbi:MAG: flagellar biosynthetic protein FliR [Deltaproteobacteria bacterium]|nr:flagellar biosynthetic protein FliR [Deltaproteobacteria bacterium]
MNLFNITPAHIETFLLIFFRIAAVLFVSPIIGAKSVPSRTKIGLAILITFILMPVVNIPTLKTNVFALVVGLIGEVMIGALIGLTVQFVLAAVELAGQIMGFQMGLSIVSAFDPMTNAQSSVIGNFQNMIATLFFLCFNAHHVFLTGFAESFIMIPPLTVSLSGATSSVLMDLFTKMLILSIKFSAPVMAMNLFLNVVLGVLGRTAPQMNIFMLGLPIQIAGGLVAIALATPIFNYVLNNSMSELSGQIQTMLRSLR